MSFSGTVVLEISLLYKATQNARYRTVLVGYETRQPKTKRERKQD